MKKIKNNEKGITIVALIITIVILLILAVVAITNVEEGGILEKANNAATLWNNAKDNEKTEFDSYLNYLNTYGGSGTGSDDTDGYTLKIEKSGNYGCIFVYINGSTTKETNSYGTWNNVKTVTFKFNEDNYFFETDHWDMENVWLYGNLGDVKTVTMTRDVTIKYIAH